MTESTPGAHLLTGAPPGEARGAAVLIHGRGGNAQDMLSLVGALALDDVAYALPAARGNSWYAGRYDEPLATLEPDLSRSLDTIDAVIDGLNEAGIPDERIVLGGFSQGACLAAQFAATRTRRFAGVAVLTGALVGLPAERAAPTGVDGLPFYICSSRHDPWIRLEDVEATAEAFAAAGAKVTLEVFDDLGHFVSDRAVAGLRKLLAAADPG